MIDFKIHILFDFVEGPWGGGNQFLKYLRKIFIENDNYSDNVENADIILFNSHHKPIELILIKKKYPEKIIVHRSAGPMAFSRGSLSNRADEFVYKLNKDLADATVFQSNYSAIYNKKLGIQQKKFEKVIHNGADESIFQRKSLFNLGKKIKIVTTSWSVNENKGFIIYKYLDDHLDFNRYEFTYIGNSPIKFKNIKLVNPIPPDEVAKRLQEFDIFFTASLFETCSNSLLEAFAVGLPCLVINSGSLAELIEKQKQGIVFNGKFDVLEKLDYLSNHYSEYLNKNYYYNYEYIFNSYYNFFKEIINNIKEKDKKKINRLYLYKFLVRKKLFRNLYKLEDKIYTRINHFRKVLILGDSPTATLSVIRSLGENDIYCDLLTFNKNSLCLKSKYVRNRYYIKSFNNSNLKWKELLKNIINFNYYSLIIPITDKYLLPIYQNINEFKELGIFAFPNKEGIEYTFDKAKTFEMAKILEIPIPKTEVINSLSDLNDKIEGIKNWPFPLFIKPTKSFIENTPFILHSKISNLDDLYKKIRKIVPITPILIQEYVYGDIIGQEFLTKEGQIISMFQHLRLHQPLAGGGSSYRKSQQINKTILEYSKKIIEFMNYTGVLMIEYKFLPKTKEKAKLLEINGRFWGSLPLCKASGVNFPLNLYQLYLDQKITVKKYEIDKYARNFNKDFLFLISNILGRKRKDSEFSYSLIKYLSELKNILTFKESWDTFNLKDIKPFLINMARFKLLIKT